MRRAATSDVEIHVGRNGIAFWEVKTNHIMQTRVSHAKLTVKFNIPCVDFHADADFPRRAQTTPCRRPPSSPSLDNHVQVTAVLDYKQTSLVSEHVGGCFGVILEA